jgi:gliding motility-associated-like protein
LVLATAGNGDCFSVQDTIAITFTPSPTIDAGADLDVCSNNPVVDLNGSVNVATGAIWSGGLGSYSTSNTDMNASYTLSPFEIQTGSVTLTLTSTGNGNCIAVQDQITVNVTSAPIVNAGVDMTICANDLNVPLNGSVVGSTNTGVWSSTGTGQFVLSPNNLNATYQASPLDSLNGTVTLTLTSTNNGLCFSESDDLVINILPNAIANAGNDQDICSSDASIQLNGSITGNASQGSWTTTGGGVFVPDANTSNATYLLDSMDASASSIQFTWTINSCDNASDDMTVNITQPSQVSVGNDVVTCVDQLDIVLNGNVTGSSNTGIWTTNGTGTFTQGSTAVANIYQASPLDSIAQSVELVLTATNTGACAADADTIVAQILPYGTVDAGVDETFCANNIALQLNGSLSGDATSIQWNTSGTGTFAPNASVLTPTYIPSAVDTAIGSVTLTLAAINSCNSANDAMTLTLTPAPFVDAGPDQTYCNLVTTFNLNGTISGITTVGAWSTTGSGSIGNPGSLNTTYTASQADINAGRIDFTLTSLNNQNCNPVTDEMTIWLTNGLIADAGPDQSVCVTSEFAQMQGSVQNGPPMGLWTTTGSGTFYPSANVLNAEYHFTPADIANGSVVLTLTSTDNGNCVAVQDQMVLTFGSASFAFAGDDQTVCANAPLVQLAGNFSGGAQGCSWTTTGTGFFSNSTDPNSSYSLSNADIASGSVTLTLTTITDGSCTASSDDIIISVDELPNVFVGVDVIACTSDPIQLSANVSNATGVNWSTSGTGTFLDPNALVTLYYPSVSDSTAGSVTLTAITTGNGECTSASDDMSISFGGNLGADAGSDVVRCSTAPDVSLAATVSGTTTGVWSTSGTGSFVPSANDLNATYIPGPADFVIGDIHLTISTTNNQGCPASKDTMTISYHNPPTVDAGQSITLCDGLQDMQLNALVQNQANMQWFTTGTGSFGPSDTIASPIYYPTANDSIVGGVHLILTAYGTGTCGNKTDSLFLDIGPTRIADAGPDQNICANGDSIQLTGNIIGVNNGVWATNGTGTFSPNAQDPNAVYTPSATDLVFNQLQFTLSTTDNQGCPAHVDTMTLNLQAPPTANAGPDISTCDASQPVQLNGSFTGATGIEWSTNGTGIFVPNAQSENALYQPSASDSLMQQVQLVISTMGNQFCDASSDTTVISFVNPLSPAFNTSNLCAGSESVLTDASQISNGNIIAWNWEFPNGVQKSGVQVQHTFPTAGQYAISLTVIADNGCSATITEVVDVLSAPTASFDMTGDPFVGFDLNFTDQSFGANSWIYDFGDGQGGSLEQNPVYQYSNPGQYLIIQTVYNSAGCADSDSMLVFIDTKDILPPKLPNAFTPNGDGTNDVFYVRGGPFETIDLKIYNGWGEVIFTTTDPEFGWDGMHEDKPAINGVYVYTIEATTTDGKSHSRTGKITLIR